MHPARRQIAFRWTAYALALLSPLAWWWGMRGEFPPCAAPPLPELHVPEAADELAVARCLAALKRVPGQRAEAKRPGAVRPTPRLLGEPRGALTHLDTLNLEQVLAYEWERDERMPHLSLVFFSGANRMAVIDGKVVREGSRLADGRRVLRIERNAVLLGGRGAVRRIPWKAPGEVRLSRSGS